MLFEMNEIKYTLSIIIPMYNVENYIGSCLDSILYSELPKGEYEVIVINDGSKDNSPQIVKDYVNKHENISCINQENQGQSVARNFGMSVCKGEYIWFVDSDDMAFCNIGMLYKKLLNNKGVDVLEFRANCITEDRGLIKTVWDRNIVFDRFYSGRDLICQGYLPTSIWNLFLRKQFMLDNNLKFIPGITHQDTELVYRVIALAAKVLFVDNIGYLYVKHENTTTTSMHPDRIIKRNLDDIVIVKSFADFSKRFIHSDVDLSLVIYRHSQKILFGIIYNLYRKRKFWKPLGVNKAVIDKLKEDSLYPLRGPFDSWKKRLLSKLLNIEWLIQ